MTTAPLEVIEPDVDDRVEPARPWVTIVWNDPVNTIDYVIYVLQKLFGYGKSKARSLTMAVHNEGRAVVSTGSREQMEGDVGRLHVAGLWATLQQDD